MEVIFKIAENAQFLSETHSEHIKRRAKVSAFKRTLLEGYSTSQSRFYWRFCEHMAIFRLILVFLQRTQGKTPKDRPKFFLDAIFKMAENAQFLS